MKVKIVAIITVIMLLFISVPVYADTPIPERPADDNWEYWVILHHPIDDFLYISSNNPIKVTTDEKALKVYNCKSYYYDGSKFVYQDVETGEITIHMTPVIIYQSNHDIEYEDGSGFFFLRPRESHLYPTMKGMDFGTILRTFSVGLIPILGCLILVLSLRKAWAFLRGQLTN
ncbi:MAG: hypothetical protein GX892_12740 [Thermoanaerobacteraceae bacterium]|nr:hypothetical protein [Thermoanaerobacteraceae bacterium]